MKEILLPLAAYHLWANELLAQAVLALPAEKWTAPTASSFPTLHATWLHLLDAEAIWWQRLKFVERPLAPSKDFSGTLSEVIPLLLAQNRQWLQWVQDAQPHRLLHEFIYHNTKREQFKQPVFQVLVHLFNHGTYHRGQVVTQLRQLGVTAIPQTDFIVWSRKKSS